MRRRQFIATGLAAGAATSLLDGRQARAQARRSRAGKSTAAELSSFIEALHAERPLAGLADKLDLYGQFVGSWDMDVETYSSDGARHAGTGEIHFGWILEGRAVQDVWMIPRRRDRRAGAPGMPVAGNWYGTTIRAYDPSLDAWRIYWIDPATNAFRQQIGRRRGADIVQEGTTDSATLSRWSFTGITPRTFHWSGEASTDGGRSWRRLVAIEARRVSS